MESVFPNTFWVAAGRMGCKKMGRRKGETLERGAVYVHLFCCQLRRPQGPRSTKSQWVLLSPEFSFSSGRGRMLGQSLRACALTRVATGGTGPQRPPPCLTLH